MSAWFLEEDAAVDATVDEVVDDDDDLANEDGLRADRGDPTVSLLPALASSWVVEVAHTVGVGSHVR